MYFMVFALRRNNCTVVITLTKFIDLSVHLIASFKFIAEYGRFVLVLGLIAGMLLPDIALAMRPWLSELVMLLLGFTSLRIGFTAVKDTVDHIKETLLIVFTFQVIFPLTVVAMLIAFGLGNTAVAMVITLVLAAPSITGAPNFAIMLGYQPEPTFRVLVIGTCCLPITIIPVLWFLPAAGSLYDVIWLSIELTVTMGLSIAIGFIIRAVLIPQINSDQKMALDGVSTLLLAVIVVGLMSAIVPTLNEDPKKLLNWLVLAFGLNYGLQVITYILFRTTGANSQNISTAIVAGNRNLAIFIVAVTVSNSNEFLIFLGCYQLPMYLTPIFMRWLYKTE